MRISTPLTSRAKKDKTVSQCVTRTIAECRERSSSAVGRTVLIKLGPESYLRPPRHSNARGWWCPRYARASGAGLIRLKVLPGQQGGDGNPADLSVPEKLLLKRVLLASGRFHQLNF